jgi:hypothetical protein
MSILEDLGGTSGLLTGALGIISLVYPPAAPIIAIIERVAPYVIAAAPLVEAGIKEGPGAFAAVKAAAPDLTQAISDLASHVFASGKFGSTPEGVQENVARAIFGHPLMTHDQEMKWMANATPGNDPSQENSKYTVG